MLRSLLTSAMATSLILAGGFLMIPESYGQQQQKDQHMLHQQHQQMMMRQTGGQVSAMDRQFATSAAQGNLSEIQLGRLALTRTQNPQVRQMAQTLINDHSSAQQDLTVAAQSANISLPQQPAPHQQNLYNRLSRLSGAEFDEAYLSSLLPTHEQTIQLYQREIQTGSNPALQQYASTTLPIVQNHCVQISSVLTDVRVARRGLPGERPVAFPQQHQQIRGFW